MKSLKTAYKPTTTATTIIVFFL